MLDLAMIDLVEAARLARVKTRSLRRSSAQRRSKHERPWCGLASNQGSIIKNHKTCGLEVMV